IPRGLYRLMEGDFEIRDLNLMLKKWPAGLTIMAAPFAIGERGTVAVDQQPCAAIGKCIDQRRRSRLPIVAELGARPVDIAGLEEAEQPALVRSSDRPTRGAM